jgi:uncharacterized protein (TIGR03382 family)
VLLLLALACAPDAPLSRDPAPAAFADKYGTACADGEVSYGIDVSYWQGTIDWDKVGATGLHFAIMRVSHGLGTYDTQFQTNWAKSKEQGLVRGAYQYFNGFDDPTEQAQLLLDEMGELQDGDLPPVLDVEEGDNEGIPASTMTAAIREWMAVVEGAIGRKPMIYTGAYAWDAMTDDADMSAYPLWTANWTDDCPYIPNPWDRWDFWQYSATGSISGISGDVDLDEFNGSPSALADWAVHTEEECSGTCLVSADEETILEEDASCACPAGALGDAEGHGGHAYTTTADQPVGETEDGVSWALRFGGAGDYTLSAWVPALSGLVSSLSFDVVHDGSSQTVSVSVDGTADGWVEVGTFHFAGSGSQSVTLGDASNVGGDAGRTVPIDALRFTLVEESCTCDDGEIKTQECSDGSVRTRECVDCAWESWSPCVEQAKVLSGDDSCEGCAATGPTGSLLAGLTALLATLRRRRSSPG